MSCCLTNHHLLCIYIYIYIYIYIGFFFGVIRINPLWNQITIYKPYLKGILILAPYNNIKDFANCKGGDNRSLYFLCGRPVCSLGFSSILHRLKNSLSSGLCADNLVLRLSDLDQIPASKKAKTVKLHQSLAVL